ncbi:methionine--tRNA ligase [Patescibacteria group bacterium]|nr:methionine--tRNA ligase [Patescibacteria group bacterium]
MGKFYVTTAIPYANSAPHIGFAMEAVQADFLARYHRLIGDDTYFLTGTDEHGIKIAETAQKLGQLPQEHVDNIADLNMQLKDLLNLSYDDFIRTTSDRHKIGSKKLWEKLVEAGDIYKGNYEGYYCSGCEAYVTEKELVDGMCPIHKTKAQKFSEENYFFKLSKYSDKIQQLIESDALKIIPLSRKKEFLNVVKGGLTDISFSRPKAALKWGIEVPNDPDQVMYVWCDALSNYITALDFANNGELFKKYWPADVHLIGKDILRFHAGIWIGMLLSAGISLPKSIYVHGFITSGGMKMSKSLGNVISPNDVVTKYGTDAMRYYLLREIVTTDDGDFTYDRFEDLYNSELANNLGNLVNRVLSMTVRYFDGVCPAFAVDSIDMSDRIDLFWQEYAKAVEDFDLRQAAEVIVALTDFANKYIEDEKPWALAKENPSKLGNVMYDLLEILRHIGYALSPFMPETSSKILLALGKSMEGVSFENIKKWHGMKEGDSINKCDQLFPRLES